MRHPCVLQGNKHAVNQNHLKQQLDFFLYCFSSLVLVMGMAEAIRTTVVPISGVIRTTVVPISGVIGPTVVRIANATGIGYRHDGSIRFSNKHTYALNF